MQSLRLPTKTQKTIILNVLLLRQAKSRLNEPSTAYDSIDRSNITDDKTLQTSAKHNKLVAICNVLINIKYNIRQSQKSKWTAPTAWIVVSVRNVQCKISIGRAPMYFERFHVDYFPKFNALWARIS